MISSFYNQISSKKQKVTRNSNSSNIFFIPEKHIAINQYKIKKQNIQNNQDFSFILDQIHREARLKKQNWECQKMLNKNIAKNKFTVIDNFSDRQKRRKQFGISERQLKLAFDSKKLKKPPDNSYSQILKVFSTNKVQKHLTE